ncbi:cuticlin 1 precursor, putative [Brugia malayi]|uniref:Bm3273 n=1 Tax=Brugia malayi TaxID=6279 RepID=A0A0H5S7V7_BRUMA|nr:cuticlin 1 precursor, putative [Brugia malayi]CRZ24798.1 Bm3273 [Brugia malayi]VIO92991.1 cuticlin 1 precursor, putative [Brugia malayi]
MKQLRYHYQPIRSFMAKLSLSNCLLLVLLVLVVVLTDRINAIPIDNGVEGEPEIECGPTSVTVNFNTRNSFEGHVYVKGLYDEQDCRSDAGGRQVAGIELLFDTCNVVRTRSLNPRGIFVTTTVVISFHPLFITKIDRAYRIQCFYMEADKTVSTQIEVSEMTTAFQTQVVPMPICRYELLDSGPTGQPIQFAIIGQPIYHKWTCESETVDTFCAIVHSCFVDDGNGDTVQILNEEGCALDKYLLNNLEYPTDLMAGQEAHVYKYADRSQLFYQCQITITIKEPNTDCERPRCSEPEGFGAVQQSSRTNRATVVSLVTPASHMRLLKKRAADYDSTVDVRTDISTLDIIDENTILPEDLRYRTRLDVHGNVMTDKSDRIAVCLSPVIFCLLISISALMMATFIVYISYFRKQNKKLWTFF